MADSVILCLKLKQLGQKQGRFGWFQRAECGSYKTNLNSLCIFFLDVNVENNLTGVILSQTEVLGQIVKGHLDSSGNVDNFTDL